MGRKSVIWLTILLVFQVHWQSALADETQVAQAKFRLFDSLLFLGKPNLKALGFEQLEVTGSAFWVGGRPGKEPDEKAVRAYARSLLERGVQLVCLDIEHWPMYPHADSLTVQGTVDKFLKIVRWMHNEAPGIQIGFYAMPPIQNYWTPVVGKLEDLMSWNRHNDELMRLGSEVDVIFPSIYTFYDDPTGDSWRTYARANIEQARKYGKPVYVFLWPQYHDSNRTLRGQPIPAGFWRQQLETAFESADGVVIWGGWKTQWNSKEGWWRSTLDFLRAHSFIVPKPPSGLVIQRDITPKQ